MYVLERSVLDLIPPGEEVSIERDVFPRLVGDGLHGLPLEGYWMDIGTPERYLQASWDILEGAVETRVEPSGAGHATWTRAPRSPPDAPLGPRRVVGPGCRIGAGVAGARIGPARRLRGRRGRAGSAARSSRRAVEVAAGRRPRGRGRRPG